MTAGAGLATHHTRVEAWECDFNGHWNTAHYCRAFQAASEGAFALTGRAPQPHRARHLRFHAELRGGEAVTVRSFRFEGQAAAVHCLLDETGRIAATALDALDTEDPDLPPLPETLLALALPRGLPEEPASLPPEPPAVVHLGALSPADITPDGRLSFAAAVRLLAVTSHHHAVGMGFARAFTDGAGIARMLVEMRHVPLGPAAAGQFLRGESLYLGRQGKSFLTAHVLSGPQPLARFDLCSLAVDRATRRAAALPAFLP